MQWQFDCQGSFNTRCVSKSQRNFGRITENCSIHSAHTLLNYKNIVKHQQSTYTMRISCFSISWIIFNTKYLFIVHLPNIQDIGVGCLCCVWNGWKLNIPGRYITCELSRLSVCDPDHICRALTICIIFYRMALIIHKN